MITGLIIGFIVGFVVGLLFYKNNKDKSAKIIAELAAAKAAVEAKLKNITSKK